MNKKTAILIGLTILVSMVAFYYLPIVPTMLPDRDGNYIFPQTIFFGSGNFWRTISLFNVVLIEIMAAAAGFMLGILLFWKTNEKREKDIPNN